MRKLKVLLITLFAACLSFTLFACGGGGGEEDEDKTVTRASGEDFTITDSYDQTAFDNYMANTYKVTISTADGERSTISGADCEITGTIEFHEIGRYQITLKPKENNENNVKTDSITVTIDHDWGAADANGKQICAHDQATKVTTEEDVAIHYGEFHDGTGATNDAAFEAAALSEADASSIGLHAETSNKAVYNSTAGINTKATAGKSNIAPFGMDYSANAAVPSLTAGALTPGMSITIEGYAKTEETAWGVEHKEWFAPSYGIADPYATDSTEQNKGNYNGGNSVIVRSEGWVLYDGIGRNPRTLAGLPAFVEGGTAANSGTVADSNYGSHPSETSTFLNGLDPKNRPAFTSDTWKDWWVYSEGKIHQTGSAYQSYTQVRVTWTYKTYTVNNEQIGFIEINSEYLDDQSSLISYIKVPSASHGFYQTIIHGDYSTLFITKSAVIQTETIEQAKVTTRANATTEYLEGQQIDASTVFNIQIISAQNQSWHDSGLPMNSDMLFYYKGTGDYAAASAAKDSTDAEVWEAVGNQPLTTAMKYFKVQFTSGQTFNCMVDKNAIKVYSNNVAAAYGDAYSNDLNSADPMLAATPKLVTESNTTYVDLALNKALLRAIPDGKASDFDTAFTDTTGYLYATIRIIGLDAENGFGTTQKGTGTNYYWIAEKKNADVVLAIAVKKDALGTPIVLTGLAATGDAPIRITIGTDSYGFVDNATVTSTTTYGALPLNVGGDVTVKYKGLTGTDYNIHVYSKGTRLGSASFTTTSTAQTITFDGGYTVTSFTFGSGAADITIKFPAFDFENCTEMPRICLEDGSSLETIAEDYVAYDLSFTATTNETTKANQSEGNVYFYAKDGTLYFATVAAKTQGNGQKVNLSTVEEGGAIININDGDREKARSYDLRYSYAGGTLAFDDQNLGNAFALKTVVLSKAYGDYGAIAIASVNIAEAFSFSGDFGFQIDGVEQSANAKHYWKYNATDRKLEYAAIAGTLEKTVLQEGDCYTTGIVATVVTSGNKTVFLADYMEVGGNHVDVTNDHICDRCGSEIVELTADSKWKWADRTLYYTNLQVGDVVDFEGTFVAEPDYLYGNLGPFAPVWADGDLFWMRSDGWMKVVVDDNWNNAPVYPTTPDDTYAPTDGEKTDNVWTDLAFNTLNGVVTLDGETIDTVVETNFEKWAANKTMRIIERVMYNEEGKLVVDVEWRFYKDTLLVLNFHQGFYVTDLSTVQFGFNYDTNFNMTRAHMVKGSTNKSAITTIAPAQVDTHTAIETVSYQTNGFDKKGNAVIEAIGSTQQYLAFQVNFASALAETTKLTPKDADGETLTGATVKFVDDTRTSILVYAPVTKDTGLFYIEIVNFEAYTLQNSICVDLSKLAVSSVTATVENTATTLAAGTFTITYANVQATDVLAVGDKSYALSALATATANASDLGNGLSAYVSTALTGNSITITFKKAAADITKQIPSYEIKLMRGTQLIMINEIAPAISTGSGFGQQIEESGWYAKADGTKLYLFGNNKNSVDTLPVNVNAGAKTANDDLGVSDLAFKVQNGVVRFSSPSSLRDATTYVYNAYGNGLTVLIIDLTDLGITANTAYGFAIETVGAQKYYKVATDRTIDSGNNMPANKFELETPDCDKDGLIVYGDATDKANCTYYGLIERTYAAHTFPEGGGNCTKCGKVAGWNVKDVKVGKTDNSQGFTVADGNNLAYNPASGAKNSSIVKGQKITARGVVTSSGAQSFNGIAILFYPGSDFNTYGTMQIRGDAWINGFNNRTGGVDKTSNLRYAITAKVNDQDYTDAAYMAIAKNANATIVWDWTDESKVVITYTLNGIETVGTYVLTVTITPEYEVFKEARYSIGIAPDAGSFTGIIECVCAKDFQNVNPAKAAETHTHGNWNAKHRCPADNTLDPTHTQHTYVKGICSECDEPCDHAGATEGEGTCPKCGATWGTANADIKVNHSTYFGGEATISMYKLWEGATHTFTAQYDPNINAVEWTGAMFKLQLAGGFYGFRYIDGAYLGKDAGWNTPLDGQNVTVGGDYTHKTHDGVNLVGTRIKIVVTYDEGTVTITITQHASTDTAFATAIATRTYTITGVTGEASFGITDQDGSHFVDDTVHMVAPGWEWAD